MEKNTGNKKKKPGRDKKAEKGGPSGFACDWKELRKKDNRLKKNLGKEGEGRQPCKSGNFLPKNGWGGVGISQGPRPGPVGEETGTRSLGGGGCARFRRMVR